MNTIRLLAACSLVVLATTAAARPFLDRVSPYGEETMSVGGSPNRVIGQTVTAGMTGDLMRVEIGIGCDSGALILEIVNLWPGREIPGLTVRSSLTIPASAIPNPPVPRTFELDRDRWPHMNTGDRFAIVLRNDTGVCTAMTGALALDGSSYPDGEGRFRRAEHSPESWFQFLDFGKTGDLGFKTTVNAVDDAAPCILNGFTPLPFPNWVPACRCLADEGLREFRCAFLHPSYFLSRHIPMPIHAGKTFEVKWTLTLFAPMKGALELKDPLSPKPLRFEVDQLPAGASITLGFEAIAPEKAGVYEIEAHVGDGSITTLLDVKP